MAMIAKGDSDIRTVSFVHEEMEANLEQCNQAENDEYVLLDLESVCLPADIPTNAPYTLSGLDTLNPTLTIGDRLKLIGEYQETIGTCYLFSETGTDVELAVKRTEAQLGDGANLKDQQHTSSQNQVAFKQIRHVATAYKVLKFRQEADS